MRVILVPEAVLIFSASIKRKNPGIVRVILAQEPCYNTVSFKTNDYTSRIERVIPGAGAMQSLLFKRKNDCTSRTVFVSLVPGPR